MHSAAFLKIFVCSLETGSIENLRSSRLNFCSGGYSIRLMMAFRITLAKDDPCVNGQ